VLSTEIPGVPINTIAPTIKPTVPTERTGVPTEDNTGTVSEGSSGVLTEGSTGVPLEGITGMANNDGDNDNPPPLVAHTVDESDSDNEDNNDADGTNAIESHHDEIPDEEVYHPDAMTPSVQRTHGLRQRKPRNYSHMFAHATVIHHAMTQYSLRKVLKKFQKVGEESVSKELKQLHIRDTFVPQNSEELSDKPK
jgi:hypothetical protein